MVFVTLTPRWNLAVATCLSVLLLGLTGASFAACTPQWAQGLFPADQLDGAVRAFCIYDDGTGLALYVGGDFAKAGGVMANHIARWKNGVWSGLDGGLTLSNGSSCQVHALCVYDDGTGPALYVGGGFGKVGNVSADNIARWKDGSWSAVGTGTDSNVESLCVYDDGSGPALYAGGSFTSAGGQTARRVAKWKSGAWSTLGAGMDSTVYTLCGYDDGTGPALYAGGTFIAAGSVGTYHIAKWKDGAWSSLPNVGASTVYALAVYDDGTGPALYVGGSILPTGGALSTGVVRWKDGAWSALGSGVNGTVYAMCGYDDGTGPAFYVGGTFTTAGGTGVNRVGKWKNGDWSALGAGVNSSPWSHYDVYALSGYDDGTGPALFAGGSFRSAGGTTADWIVRWRSNSWQPLGNAINGDVRSFCVYDDGTGPALYVGGYFTATGGTITNRVARWQNHTWTALGSGANSAVLAICVYDDGTGPALYAGGYFTTIGGVTANGIAKWKDGAWSPLGNGIGGVSLPFVSSLAVYDDGTGPALYASGYFATAGGVTANNVARWTGGEWSAVGSGTVGSVLCVYDDGTGPALYSTGSFPVEGGTTPSCVGIWKNGAWSPVGTLAGVTTKALCVHDDGTGPALYVGGGSDLTTADGMKVNGVAKWKDGVWSSVGGGIGGVTNPNVDSLCVYDDGTGPALYAGGDLKTAGGVMVDYIAKWKGGVWSPLSTGTNSIVYALTVYDDGSGPALYVGGNFTSAGGFPSGHVARWGGCENPTTATDIGSVKALPDSSLVSLTGPVSTTVSNDSFYIEDQDRSSGILVSLPAHGITRDHQVIVTGRLRTNVDGERFIYGFSAAELGPLSVEPLGMNLNALGGSDWAFDPLTGAGQHGTAGGTGLSNIGLLVRCSGRFIAGGNGFFRIDDGSGKDVLVTVPSGVAIDGSWQYVSLTGISSCVMGSDGPDRVIRVREQSDIQGW